MKHSTITTTSEQRSPTVRASASVKFDVNSPPTSGHQQHADQTQRPSVSDDAPAVIRVDESPGQQPAAAASEVPTAPTEYQTPEAGSSPKLRRRANSARNLRGHRDPSANATEMLRSPDRLGRSPSYEPGSTLLDLHQQGGSRAASSDFTQRGPLHASFFGDGQQVFNFDDGDDPPATSDDNQQSATVTSPDDVPGTQPLLRHEQHASRTPSVAPPELDMNQVHDDSHHSLSSHRPTPISLPPQDSPHRHHRSHDSAKSTSSKQSRHHTAVSMRHAAFARFAARDGERFTIVEQSDGAAPVLRDFASAKVLVDHLQSVAGDYRSLQCLDDDVEEPQAHDLERALSRNLGRHASQYVSESDSDHGGGVSGASSSTSSSSTMSGLLPERTMWIDVQSDDQDTIETILEMFPRLERDTMEDLFQHDAVDTAHWFPNQRYLFANMDCREADINNSSFSPVDIHRFDMAGLKTVVVSIVAFSDVCVTIHARPFSGHTAVLTALHGIIAAKRRPMTATVAPTPKARPSTSSRRSAKAQANGLSLSGSFAARGASAFSPSLSGTQGFGHKRTRLTVGTIVATLVESVISGALPDPTACLAEVDRIDEMVLLVSNDSHDLLRRIARVRRVLSTHRSALYRKERFLQQFTSPALRATFISGFTTEQYRHTLGEVYHVAERLEAARDILTQANSNFVSHISLQTAKVSNDMNLKMKSLSQVATICLPLNIITGLFGMNVTVPYNTTQYPSTLAPFFTIVACMTLFLIVGIPFVWRSMRTNDKLLAPLVE